jgi:hypothetical protein
MAKVKSGYGLPPENHFRRMQTSIDKSVGPDLGRGVLGGLPLQDVVIGTSTYLVAVDVPRSIPLGGIAIQAADAGLGTIQVALYRASAGDVLPGSWRVRRGQVLSQALTAAMTEYVFAFDNELVIDPTDAAWMVAVMGSAAGATVRGTSAYTPPAFSAWRVTPGALPAEVTSGQVVRTLDAPAAALLTPIGVRLRGTGA